MHSARPPLAEHQDCNGKNSARLQQFSMDEPRSEEENIEDDGNMGRRARLRRWARKRQPAWCRERSSWALYIFPPQSKFRTTCNKITSHKMFDHIVLVIIFLNCITIAMERPRIDPHSAERIFLTLSNYIFTVIFLAEMMVKVVALGWFFGDRAYLKSSWNILDGLLVLISIIDILVSMISTSGTKILGMLRVLRLLRTLRPLRVISRAPGLKLVVETLMSSLKPIGNIVVICCAFFIIFGILGVQLFKGKFFVCQGEEIRNVTNKSDCLLNNYKWVRHKYNFDNLGQALMALFVLASKDGWVDIMYDGLDAVGVDQQPVMNYNPWMLLYFISFLLIVSFFVLNMFVGVVVENFHKCRKHQEAEEAKIREEKRLRRMEKKRRKAQCKPYYSDYSPSRLLIHKMCTSHYLDLFITVVIGLNVITMAMEHYQQPKVLDEALKICNYIFTIIFVLESVFKLVAFGFRRFFKERWNQLDLAIVLLSIMGITLEEIEVNASLPINPTIIRIMRVLRIARVLKLLKMAVGMRSLLDTVMQALPQVGNLGLLFMLLFFIFAALGVELFGDLVCDDTHPCEGLGRHATFRNFGMAFLTLFRVSTGDNWNGIMKDTLRDCAQDTGTCYNTVVSPLYFVSFVLTAQFVLVNVVIAVLMKHLEESNKEAKEEAELEAELELELRSISNPAPVTEGLPWANLRTDSPDPAPGKGDSPLSLEPPLELAPVLQGNLLSVRKPSVGRAHSLPNDSYMFQTLDPAASPKRDQSGSTTSVQSQPTGSSTQHLAVPVPLFRPISPPGHPGPLDCESIPKIPPPRRSSSTHRTLHRQVAVINDSSETLYTESKEAAQPPQQNELSSAGLASPAVLLVPATPGASPALLRSSVHTQYNISSQPRPPGPRPRRNPFGGHPSLDPADQEVSHITASPALKKYHSVDAQAPQQRLLLARPSSWLDDPRRHSIEICSSVESSPQRSSGSSGFVSRAESFQLPSPHRKKKMSPPCISVEPPESQPSLPPLPGRDSCLRRRAPSCDSKDSVDLGGEAVPADGPPVSPKLLTLPSFSFEQMDAEH